MSGLPSFPPLALSSGNEGTQYETLWGGNSWITFDVWTVALPKATTLLITNADTNVTAANGQTRLTAQDRFFVLTFDVTSTYGLLVVGVNTVLVLDRFSSIRNSRPTSAPATTFPWPTPRSTARTEVRARCRRAWRA